MQAAQQEERQAVLGRLEAIAARDLDDRVLTPGEAATIIGWVGELQLHGLKALARDLDRKAERDALERIAKALESLDQRLANRWAVY